MEMLHDGLVEASLAAEDMSLDEPAGRPAVPNRVVWWSIVVYIKGKRYMLVLLVVYTTEGCP